MTETEPDLSDNDNDDKNDEHSLDEDDGSGEELLGDTDSEGEEGGGLGGRGGEAHRPISECDGVQTVLQMV